MRPLILIAMALIFLSCGKNGVALKSSPSPQEVCGTNGNDTSCETVEEGAGVELLESVIDVKVKTTNSEITFLENKKSIASGERIICETSVRAGESYLYTLRNKKLWVKTLNESFEMERLNDGEGLSGTWLWKGVISQGTQVFRSLTFIGSNQVIMRTSCEL